MYICIYIAKYCTDPSLIACNEGGTNVSQLDSKQKDSKG